MNALFIALKDLHKTARSFFALGMLLGAPLLLTALLHFAFGRSGTPRQAAPAPSVTLVVADQDRAAAGGLSLGRQLVTSLRQPSSAGWWRVHPVKGELELREALGRDHSSFGLVIPSGFSRAVEARAVPPSLRLLESGNGDPAVKLALQGSIEQFLGAVTAARVAEEAADFVSRRSELTLTAENRNELARRQSEFVARILAPHDPPSHAWLEVRAPDAGALVAGSTAPEASVLPIITSGLLLFFIFFSAGHAAQSITLEDQEGTLARLFASPTSHTQIVIGKFLAVFASVGVQAALLFGLSSAILGIAWGNASRVSFVVGAVVLGAGGFGVLLVALARNAREASIIVSTVSAGAGMLGGLFTSALPMPLVFEVAGLLVPQGWAMRGFRLLLAGAGFRQLMLPAAVSCLIGAVCLALGGWLFRRRFS
jgi:ABC-2 type transport system permease protein